MSFLSSSRSVSFRVLDWRASDDGGWCVRVRVRAAHRIQEEERGLCGAAKLTRNFLLDSLTSVAELAFGSCSLLRALCLIAEPLAKTRAHLLAFVRCRSSWGSDRAAHWQSRPGWCEPDYANTGRTAAKFANKRPKQARALAIGNWPNNRAPATTISAARGFNLWADGR